MSKRTIPLVQGEYYHIYNRGNDKKIIFLDQKDQEHFIKLLYLCNSKKPLNFRNSIVSRKIDAWDYDAGEKIVSIGAWVLMPNHFHIYIKDYKGNALVKVNEDKGSSYISIFMIKLCTSYTMYFNKKYGRTGKLFEGKFKSVHIKDEIQAKYLFSYIHLNPVKLIQKDWREVGIKDREEALKYLDKYVYSSYLDFKDMKRDYNKILTLDDFPQYFPNKDSFTKEIFEWLSYKDGDQALGKLKLTKPVEI